MAAYDDFTIETLYKKGSDDYLVIGKSTKPGKLICFHTYRGVVKHGKVVEVSLSQLINDGFTVDKDWKPKTLRQAKRWLSEFWKEFQF